jgi:hypothetical protein
MTSGDADRHSEPDWQDEAQYSSLLELDRPGWAWEWLRRNADYIAEVQGGLAGEAVSESGAAPTIICSPSPDGASRWGLCFPRSRRSPG